MPNSYLLGLRHWEIMAFLKTEDGNNIGIIALRLLSNECNVQTYLTEKVKGREKHWSEKVARGTQSIV